MINIVSKHKLDEATRRCLIELESEINKVLNAGNKLEYKEREVSQSDMSTMKEGDIVIDQKRNYLLVKIAGKLKKAELTDL